MTWQYLSGDTSSFAVQLALVTDDVDDWMVDADERRSWGTIAIWVNGRNVCEHTAQAETIEAAHWYLLPVAEWLVSQWDGVLHEERLPLVNRDTSGARGLQSAALVAELDSTGHAGDDSADIVQQWAYRHSLRMAAPGALLPDLCLRRLGDSIEFSIGSDPLPGQSRGVVFTTSAGPVGEVPADRVAETLFDSVSMLASTLVRRDPGNSRYQALADGLANLTHRSREAIRLAWLSGAGGDVDKFRELWDAVDATIPTELGTAFGEQATPPPSEQQLVLLASPAALLFGSIAPEVSSDDIAELYSVLLTTAAQSGVAEALASHGAAVMADSPVRGLTPGQQGSLYGEQVWHRLMSDRSGPVDIHGLLKDLGVAVEYVSLRDITLRAVSMIGLDGSARIVVNRSFYLGTSEPIERFTLAHELAHLLLDQDRATHMVVASGPWAPKGIEQRASAFAAAFLAPVALLGNDLIPGRSRREASDMIRAIALRLNVSYSALVSRLQNLGRLSTDDAEVLREPRI
jgi:hypothetical protein